MNAQSIEGRRRKLFDKIIAMDEQSLAHMEAQASMLARTNPQPGEQQVMHGATITARPDAVYEQGRAEASRKAP